MIDEFSLDNTLDIQARELIIETACEVMFRRVVLARELGLDESYWIAREALDQIVGLNVNESKGWDRVQELLSAITIRVDGAILEEWDPAPGTLQN